MNARRLTQGHGQTDAQGAYATHAYFSRSLGLQRGLDLFALTLTFLVLLALILSAGFGASLYLILCT